MHPGQSPAKGNFVPLASCDADDSDSDNEALLWHAAATAVGGGGGQNAHRGASPVASTTGGYVLQFFALPSQVFVILLLEFLNSYRNFGLRFVQYQYINNEFSMGDIETGSLLGINRRSVEARQCREGLLLQKGKLRAQSIDEEGGFSTFLPLLQVEGRCAVSKDSPLKCA